jgi:DNA-binding response OmpR family regulator
MSTLTLPKSKFGQAIGGPARLLIVDDDPNLRKQLAEGLGRDGHRIFMAEDLPSARSRLENIEFDAVLLDVDLPGGSGYELLRELRNGFGAAPADLPVLLVSGYADEVDRVRGFEFGCDDYIAKPFSFVELRGRLAAVLRRSDVHRSPHRTVIETISIDRRARAVFVENSRVELTSKEYSLLLALAEDPERVYTREELLVAVWGYRSQHSSRTLDAHACRLRAKLSTGDSRYVVNLWGVGYRLLEHSKLDQEAGR